MQFQVPQFIETEDKIVGPLTLKQFGYIGGAVGVSFFLYATASRPVFLIISLPLLALGIGLAFVKVNGQPLIKTLGAAFVFYLKPQTYVWLPENPALPKNAATLRSAVGSGLSLENIVAGISLKNARTRVETGGSASPAGRGFGALKEKYEIFRGLGGEQKAAHRVDYR